MNIYLQVKEHQFNIFQLPLAEADGRIKVQLSFASEDEANAVILHGVGKSLSDQKVELLRGDVLAPDVLHFLTPRLAVGELAHLVASHLKNYYDDDASILVTTFCPCCGTEKADPIHI